MKTSITQIYTVCHLLPFAKVGQYGGPRNLGLGPTVACSTKI